MEVTEKKVKLEAIWETRLFDLRATASLFDKLQFVSLLRTVVRLADCSATNLGVELQTVDKIYWYTNIFTKC